MAPVNLEDPVARGARALTERYPKRGLGTLVVYYQFGTWTL